MAIDVALFVSKRLMPVALLLLASMRLAYGLATSPRPTSAGAASAAAPVTEVRVVIGR